MVSACTWIPDCNTCGDADDVSGPDDDDEYHCSHCDHYIDGDGDCVTSDCSKCDDDDEQSFCYCGQQAARNCRNDQCGSCCSGDNCSRHGDWVPSCNTCECDSDVTGPDEDDEYYCSDCDHHIDDDGDCVSDCDSCEGEGEYEEPDLSAKYCPGCGNSTCEIYILQKAGGV